MLDSGLPPRHSVVPRNAPVTLDDVARIAQVSAITVSRVINRPGMVSERTAKRVQKAIDKTGYVPNLAAGSLVSQRSRLVIVVMPSIANHVFVETIRHLSLALAKERYQLMLIQSAYTEASEMELIATLLARRPDGLVLTTSLRSPEARKRLLSRDLPVVEAWELKDDPIDAVVGFSHAAAGAAMAQHMLDRGHRQYGLVWSNDARAASRLKACMETLLTGGATVAQTVLVDVPVSVGYGRSALATILESHPDIDAVICSIDLLAQGVLAEAQARHIHVPKQLAVMGFGDLDFAAHIHPPLSTVRADGARIGEFAAQFLLQRISGQSRRGELLEDVGFEVVGRKTT
jgi:LacI family gluconate utilization system Gnt-I transcriptional repressor